MSIIPTRITGMGAITIPVPISNTIKVEYKWGNTHGEARVTGLGKYLIIDISNKGNHHCREYSRMAIGSEILEKQADGSKFCEVCLSYKLTIVRSLQQFGIYNLDV